MKHILFILLASISLSCASTPTESPQLIIFQKGSLYGYKDPMGKVIISPDYMIAHEFQQEVAHVADRQKWMVIDKKGKILFTPFIYDNGPDPFQEGLARFVQDDKIGYYTPLGQISVPPKFDFGYPFKNGKAKVCVGCKKKSYGEHYRYRGGKWFYIDARGYKYKKGN
ncbi:MAG: WG repeat-containing protein [Spirochaetota bacterium]